ncbi:Dolichyl-phosphate-mannose-protein mannosyltransferase [Pedococcus dokdonensis]|uniref:Dolichyl-phosphate-mannose-protein mannosyltransferase n=1 Tax=Pedococcus dokdonensis TaxID=443156 RepID=A0A1H0RHF2_9MICO|nr:glycosyltransferase family 39 protein [Pedococcus dokdonensis]SDP28992.1 Dolichyl-phosphate-mannose-protein mannosyltransferase [Pedococcus dokdonensis]
MTDIESSRREHALGSRDAVDEARGDAPAREAPRDPKGPGESRAVGARDWLAGARWTRVDVLTAALVGVLVMVVAYVFRSIVVPTDPWHYVRSALEFPSDDWVPLGYTRYGIILANIPPARLFGNAQASYYFWPLLSAGLLSGAVYLLGRRWWGRLAGLVAVVLVVSNAVVFYNLSRGYPDIMSMALFTLAIVVALLARDRESWDRWTALLVVAVGFLLGWGFETRETSMLAWPLIAVILWRRGRLVRTAIFLLLPLALWAAIDVGISAVAYGDPLLKLHVLSGTDISATKTATGELANGNLVNQPRLSYFTFIPKMAWGMEGGSAMVVIGIVAALGIFVRNAGVRLMAWWFLGVYLLTVLAAGGLDPAHPRGRLDIARYWIPFVPAESLVVAGMAALAVAWVVRRLASSRVPRGVVQVLPALVAVAVLAVPVTEVARYATVGEPSTAFAVNGGDALEELRDHLDAQDFSTTTVWTDWETVRILPAYQREFFGGDKVWNGRGKSITGKRAKPVSGDYVLLFQPGSRTCGFCLTALTPWTIRHPSGPPSTWEPVFESSARNLTLYRVR